ncbi:MAG: transporter substrate-binding domain-containing protein [Bacteroidota bacterium]|nr:transporter substrate-binding domain-containing protein [Bacteroidota bacterium]
MRHLIHVLIFILTVNFFSCSNRPKDDSGMIDPIERDLDKIKAGDTLRALVVYSPTSYFLYRGRPMGFEYELLKKLAKNLDLTLDLHISKNIDDQFDQLNTGTVDIVAYGLTITKKRKQEVNFTEHLYLTHQVLVQKKPDYWRKMTWAAIERELIHDAVELGKDTISVRKNSSYAARLQNLSEEIGEKIYIDTVPGDMSTDKIIKKVAEGEYKYTIADDNIAKINASYMPILDVDVPISFSQKVGWAVRKNSPELLAAINQWGVDIKKTVGYYVIYNRYFKKEHKFKVRIKSDFFSLNDNKISQYDELIQRYSKKINWDWRLVASLIYQESQFNPLAKSWAGAKGLMQVMPATAKGLGITNRNNPEDNIRGGTKYLKKLWLKFEMIPDSVQRLKFAIASYNCGYFHVKDAQKLAEHYKLETKVWDENVDKMILKLSYPKDYNRSFIKFGYVRGIEPYTYVNQIFERYEHYKQFIELPE